MDAKRRIYSKPVGIHDVSYEHKHRRAPSSRTITEERERADHSKPHLKLIVKPITINKQDRRGWNLVKQASSSVDLLPVGHFWSRANRFNRDLMLIERGHNLSARRGGQVRHSRLRARTQAYRPLP